MRGNKYKFNRNKLNTILIIIFIFSRSLYSQECFFVSTETRYWDASKSYNGYTLFGSGGNTYLIDMEGKVVNKWKIGTNPRFTPGGTIIDAAGGDPSNSNTWKELDWNGNVIWQYSELRKGYYPHHDFEKIYNPKLGDSTFIYIANKDLTLQQCLDAGADPANSKNYSTAQMDVIVEVDMKGNIIWEWSFFDHIVQELDKTKSTYGVVKDTPGKLNINLRGNPLQKDWLHSNSLDYNENLDLIVINSVQGEFYVIDHGNTFVKGDATTSISNAASSKGDFLYRFGDPARYNQGDPPSVLDNWTKATTGHKQIGGAHNIQWIKKGLPGEGNFLIFNNSENLFELTPQSYIVEINPYLNSSGISTGKFVNPPLAGYNIVNSPDRNLMKEKRNVSKQVVWTYSSKNNVNFYSTIGSSAQRLPNGNTFVCSMNDGHFFEVSSKDTLIVWEYINPITRSGIKRTKTDTYPTDNAAFRAYRYSKDDSALKGRDLTSKLTISGKTPLYLIPSDLTTSIEIDYDNQSKLLQSTNYPNPLNQSTIIAFELENGGNVKIEVVDLNGNIIKKLIDQVCSSGKNEVKWDGKDNLGRNVNSGVYYYTIYNNEIQETKEMLIIK